MFAFRAQPPRGISVEPRSMRSRSTDYWILTTARADFGPGKQHGRCGAGAPHAKEGRPASVRPAGPKSARANNTATIPELRRRRELRPAAEDQRAGDGASPAPRSGRGHHPRAAGRNRVTPGSRTRRPSSDMEQRSGRVQARQAGWYRGITSSRQAQAAAGAAEEDEDE